MGRELGVGVGVGGMRTWDEGTGSNDEGLREGSKV